MDYRHIMLEIANIADVAGISRALYKDHRDLGEMDAALAKAFEFFKYIRNKFAGHIVEGLTSKTFEWIPQAYGTLGKTDAAHQLILSLFVLETVINTYTDPTTGHKIFESETDLNYPPDRTRSGLVTDLCRSPISLCHLGFECEGADAAQI